MFTSVEQRWKRQQNYVAIEWYSKYVFLVGAVLSFADPITDILTLVQFYRQDHKTWFTVGLGFVFLPWMPFGYYYASYKRPHTVSNERSRRAPSCKWLKSFLIGFHPFTAAVARLEMFVLCLKEYERATDFGSPKFIGKLKKMYYSQVAAFFEAVLESAPQFVIQLYVISIQQERVSVIQLASLPVSFLSLVWTFTSVDVLNQISHFNIHVKHKCILFVTNLFLVGSRLCAVVYFTVSYKWWIVSVEMLHSIIMLVVGYIFSFRQNGRPSIRRFMSIHGAGDFIFGKFCVQWIRDDLPFFPLKNKNPIRWVANSLFVVENLVMILSFHFSGHSNTWYALPVTVCVCSFTVLGGIMRITHFYVLGEQHIETRNIHVDPQLQKNTIPSTNFQTFYYYETAV